MDRLAGYSSDSDENNKISPRKRTKTESSPSTKLSSSTKPSSSTEPCVVDLAAEYAEFESLIAGDDDPSLGICMPSGIQPPAPVAPPVADTGGGDKHKEGKTSKDGKKTDSSGSSESESSEQSSEEESSGEESDSEEDSSKKTKTSRNLKKKSSSSESESDEEGSSDSEDSDSSTDRNKKSKSKQAAKRSEKKSESPVRKKSTSRRTRSRSKSRRSRSRSRSKSKRSKSRDRRRHHRRRSSDRRHRGSRHHGRRSRSRDRRRSNSRSRRKRSHSREKRRRRPTDVRRRSRSRDRRHGRRRVHRRRSRSRSPVLKLVEKKPVSYKDMLKQKLIEAQKQASDGSMVFDPTTLPGALEKPSPLPLMSINPLMSLATGPPGSDKLTPEQSLAITMAAMHQKAMQVTADKLPQAIAQQLTGIAVPTYYNPAAVNPLKFADQVKKRKLLWSKKDASSTSTEAPPTVPEKPESTETSHSAFLEDKDGKVTAKFRKLMGIKRGEESEAKDPTTDESALQKQQELFTNLDREYQMARMATHTHRGIGLGFATPMYPDAK